MTLTHFCQYSNLLSLDGFLKKGSYIVCIMEFNSVKPKLCLALYHWLKLLIIDKGDIFLKEFRSLRT